jgi:two-component system, LytTR family, response regulator LytT
VLRAFIVDDEPLARDELKYLLSRSKQVDIVGESDCIEDAFCGISEHKPDLVFLDIELADDSGLSLAKQLESLDPAPAIVFATAYDEYALQAFQLNAVDYIQKPFDEKRILQTLEKIKKIQHIGHQDEPVRFAIKSEHHGKIAILVDERIVLLTQPDIVYLESSEGKCTVKTVKQEYKVNEALVVLEKKLKVDQFLRVHRSFVVNLDQIVEIEPWFNSTYNLHMKDGSKVPVSRTYVKELKLAIGL